MKKVFLDMSGLSHKTLGGIGRYSLFLSRALIQQQQDFQFCAGLNIQKILKRRIVCQRLNLPVKFWTQFHTYLSSADTIYHGLDFKVPRGGKFKKVVTIHDLVEFEEEFNSKEFIVRAQKNFRTMLQQSCPDKIITVSNFTRQKIAQLFPEYAPLCSTVYHGCDNLTPSLQVPREKNLMLYVGTLEYRKNTARVVEAFNILSAKHKSLKLVLAGGKGYRWQEVLQVIEQSPAKDRIQSLGAVSDQELHNLWSRASLFVFPSLYEGFGMPILESMRMGCPVLTSNIGAMAEVSAQAALQCDPYQVQDIAEKADQILSDISLAESLTQKGLLHSQTFTWQNCAAKTLNVYKSLVN